MVLKVFADTGQVMFHRNTVIAKLCPRPNSRQFEDLRRSDCARRQNDLAVGPYCFGLATALIGHAPCNRTFNFETHHCGLCHHRQIGPRQDRLQEGARGTPANAAFLRHIEIARSFIVTGVEIIGFGNADFFGRIADRIKNIPAQALPFDTQFTVVAMTVCQFVIIFGFHKIGQNIIPAPASRPL